MGLQDHLASSILPGARPVFEAVAMGTCGIMGSSATPAPQDLVPTGFSSKLRVGRDAQLF